MVIIHGVESRLEERWLGIKRAWKNKENLPSTSMIQASAWICEVWKSGTSLTEGAPGCELRGDGCEVGDLRHMSSIRREKMGKKSQGLRGRFAREMSVDSGEIEVAFKPCATSK